MSDSIALASLEFIPYVDDQGQLPETLQGKVGVYAIFDRDQALQYIGYSRDVLLSLKQHLVRRVQFCYWVKAHLVDRPNRTALEATKASWIAEHGIPPGNNVDESCWNQPIDVKLLMTEAEQTTFAAAIDEVAQTKLLKTVARRVEAEILSSLADRGVKVEMRFNPKLKETGLLDLK